MKRSLTRNLGDVSFHDSTIERFARTGDTITLTFDWAKIAYEGNALILGRCCLQLFKVSYDEFSHEKYHTNCLGAEYSLVGINRSDSDHELVLGGFFVSSAEHSWIEWKCAFESFSLQWNEDVTVEEWRNGKLPNAEQRVEPTPPRVAPEFEHSPNFESVIPE